MLPAEEAGAFRAVGRLNIAGRRFCTATLIEPAIVLTAAHCLFHPLTGARVPVSEMRFVAGLRLGKAVAVRRVTRAVPDPAFRFDGAPDYAGVRADLALLELDSTIPADVVPTLPVTRAGGSGRSRRTISPSSPTAATGRRRFRSRSPAASSAPSGAWSGSIARSPTVSRGHPSCRGMRRARRRWRASSRRWGSRFRAGRR